MLIDITLKITPKMVTDAQGNEKKALVGHLGTHFDVMNKEFPLEYTKRRAIVFDVSDVGDRDIDIDDIVISKVEQNMFVAFYTGFIEKEGYGGKEYFTGHPQLSDKLIDALLDKGVSIIVQVYDVEKNIHQRISIVRIKAFLSLKTCVICKKLLNQEGLALSIPIL